MAGSVRVVLSGDGRPAAVKRARGTGADRLRHEAGVLRLVAGPGIVELIAVTEIGDGAVELATAYAGATTLETARPPDTAGAVAVLAGIGRALTRAHGAGAVHERLTADHVVLGPDGPVVCGWGDATLSTGPAVDGGRDVRGLAELALVLLDGAGDDIARRVCAVARNAIGGDSTPPAMATFTAALEAVVPPAPPPRLRGRPAIRTRARETRRPGRGASAAVAGLAIAAAATAGATFLPSGTTGAPRDEVATTTVPDGAPSSSTIATSTTAVASRVWPRDVPVVEHGGRRWEVGRAGDLAFEVPWGCDPAPRLVVLRPETGDVFVFDAWPAGGDTPAGRAVGRVDGAHAVRATDVDGDRCGELEVLRDGGAPVVVDPAAAPGR